jgi:hypothetical protein
MGNIIHINHSVVLNIALYFPYQWGGEKYSAPFSATCGMTTRAAVSSVVRSALCTRGHGRGPGEPEAELKDQGITMSKTPTSGRRSAPAPGSSRSPALRSTAADPVRAQARREALKDFMVQNKLTPSALARRIGAPNPNLFYNFLNGRSVSLSQQTLELIHEAFPGSHLGDRLDGRRTRQATCTLVAEARAGVGQSSFMLPADRRTELVLPPGIPHGGEGIFAVRVEAPGAEGLYPTGSILICRPFGHVWDAPPARPRVIVQRQIGAEVEVTVRDLVIREDMAWLWPRSTHPDHQEPIPMRWPPREPVNPANTDGSAIVGIVLASWQPEAAAPRP